MLVNVSGIGVRMMDLEDKSRRRSSDYAVFAGDQGFPATALPLRHR